MRPRGPVRSSEEVEAEAVLRRARGLISALENMETVRRRGRYRGALASRGVTAGSWGVFSVVARVFFVLNVEHRPCVACGMARLWCGVVVLG